MKLNRLYVLISLSFALLSGGRHVAAMQSLPQSSSSTSSTVRVFVCGVAATIALVSSALGIQSYRNNQKVNKPQPMAPTTPQQNVVEVNSCQSDIAPKIKELHIVPATIADLIAAYAAVEPKTIKRAPFYGFGGMRPR